MRELADIAGADISTVSRALNNDPRISEQRATAIKKIAEDLGYRPKPLRSKKTHSIGILISTSEKEIPKQEFLRRITWLGQWILGQNGKHVNIENIPGEIKNEAFLPELIQQSRVDGVILAGYFEEFIIENIRKFEVPIVAINDSSKRTGTSCVTSDSQPAIKEIITHLAAKGHEKFACLNTNISYPTIKSRYERYINTLKEFGIKAEKQFQIDGLSGGIDGGVEGIRKLKEEKSFPTAILCCNDWIALGAIQELQRSGLKVPEDVSIVGHDNLHFCDQLEPKLTSIHRDEKEIVVNAVNLLQEQIDGKKQNIKDVVLDGKVVWRDSTGITPTRLGKK